MTIEEKSSIKQFSKGWMLKILYYDSYFSPTVFFLFAIFQELNFLDHQYYTFWLFWAGIAFYLLTCINHFFFYSAILTSSISIYFPSNVIIGLIASNKKWKAYLLWFVLSYYLPNNSQDLKQIFIIISSSVVCLECLRDLIFETIRDNITIFSGLFSIFCLHTADLFLENAYEYELTRIERVCLFPLLVLLGYGVVKARIKSIQMRNFTEIKSPTLLIHYIRMMNKSFENVQNFHTFIHLHKQQCNIPECYCQKYRNQNFLQIDPTIISTLITQAIDNIYLLSFQCNSWGLEDKLILMHRYAEFLIGLKQKPRAISILSHALRYNMGYFNKCENYLVRKKLQESFSNGVEFDIQQSKLNYIYNYDLQVGYVNKEIRQILQNKIQFWKQLCKENPRLKSLQMMGRKLVKRIQDLHEYFSYVVRPCEQSLSLIHCTILYASYLFLTTNYLQFANSLAKKAQKMFEQKKGQLVNGCQFGLFLKVRQNYSSNEQQNYDLVIENISTRLSLMLKFQKKKIINKYLTALIPDQFRLIHNKKFDEFYKKSNLLSCVLGTTIELPYKAGPEQVLFLETSAVIRYDPVSNCASIQCLIKTVTNDAINFIVDMECNLKYKQSALFQNYVSHPTIKQIITTMRQEWKNTGFMTEGHRNVEQNQNIFSFACIALHTHRMKQIGKQPLIRVIVRNENFRNEKLRIFNFENIIRFKQVQCGAVQTENDSQASTSSRKDSIENVIEILKHANSLKTQRFLTITLLLLLIFAILSFNVCLNIFNIWSTDIKEKNPTFTVINLINFKNIFNTVISWYYDIQLVQINPSMPLINTIYNNRSIQSVGKDMFSYFLTYQKNLLDSYLLGTGNEAKEVIRAAFDTVYDIQNPIVKPTIQQMSLQSIIGNFIVDIYTLYSGQPYIDTMLSFVYLEDAYAQLTVIENDIINKLTIEVATVKRNNIILISFICVFFLTFLIPIWKFNVSNKKKHEQIYNLLASIQSKLIVDEIKKLMQIQEEVFASFNSNEQKQSTEDNNIPSLLKINYLSKISERKQKQINKAKDFFLILSGVKKVANELIMSHEKTNELSIKVRKRGGEISIEGSDCDRKKFIPSDWIAVLFILLFVAITFVMFWQKLYYVNKVNDSFLVNLQQMSNLEDMSLALLNAKMFVDSFNLNDSLVDQNNLSSWLRNWIISYHSQNLQAIDVQATILTCVQNILLCKLSSSQKIIQSIIKMSIADSYQQNYYWLKNSSRKNESLLQKSRFLLFFSQSLIDYLRNQKFQWSLDSFDQLQMENGHQNQNKILFTSIFWLLIGIFCSFSIFYAIGIKRRYVKEVTLLSILNKEMIYDNKRVESFVHSLSKGTL